MRACCLITMIVLLNCPIHAGRPEFVAGASFFDPTIKGVPVTWPQGVISYFIDQGDLSPILLGTNADSFIATAFGMWSSVPTAAIRMTQAGHLAEDVNGTNFSAINNVITGPTDITPSATATPVGIIYDAVRISTASVPMTPRSKASSISQDCRFPTAQPAPSTS